MNCFQIQTGQLTKRRSVSAGIVCFQGCLLLSTSRTQRVIALSSAEAEIHAVSTTCDGLLLRVCLEFCIGCKVRLKLILDNSAAKQVLHRSGVGRIRHLSCRVLWVQQLVKTKALETSSIPYKGKLCRPWNEEVVSRQNEIPHAWCWCVR